MGGSLLLGTLCRRSCTAVVLRTAPTGPTQGQTCSLPSKPQTAAVSAARRRDVERLMRRSSTLDVTVSSRPSSLTIFPSLERWPWVLLALSWPLSSLLVALERGWVILLSMSKFLETMWAKREVLRTLWKCANSGSDYSTQT